MSGTDRPKPPPGQPGAGLPLKARAAGFAIASVIRGVGATLRFECDDRAGMADRPRSEPVIWAFWHNRVFTAPLAYRRFLAGRSGAVLTSASKDGDFLAASIGQFGVAAVRGSSAKGGRQKRGAAALVGLARWLEAGYDVAITPDGPRGPAEQIQPGLLKLAQLTGVPILPIRLDYRDCWRLKTWDRFMVPKPFSRIAVTLQPLVAVPRAADEAALADLRAGIEGALKP